MTDLNVTISRNTLVDRLRLIQSRLTDENEHADALIIDMAIQSIDNRLKARIRRSIGQFEPIQIAVCTAFGVTLKELLSSRRHKSIVHARHIAMGLAHTLSNASLPDIAHAFCKRDHTTIIHALKKTKPLMDQCKMKVPSDSSIEAWVKAAIELSSGSSFKTEGEA